VLAIDLRRRGKAGSAPERLLLRQPLVLDIEDDRPRDVEDREVAVKLQRAVACHFDPRALERERGVLLDVEDVGRAKVRVAVGLTGIDAGGAYAHLDARVFGRLSDANLAVDVREMASYLRDHQVTGHESHV